MPVPTNQLRKVAYDTLFRCVVCISARHGCRRSQEVSVPAPAQEQLRLRRVHYHRSLRRHLRRRWRFRQHLGGCQQGGTHSKFAHRRRCIVLCFPLRLFAPFPFRRALRLTCCAEAFPGHQNPPSGGMNKCRLLSRNFLGSNGACVQAFVR